MGHRHFVIAGAQRCGTTLLYRLLDAHPEIVMARPERPEPKFFLRAEAEHLGHAGYDRIFPGDAVEPAVYGEKSTSYIESEEAARRMAEILPGLRLLFVLRDPVDRAVSNYRFSRDHGVETESLETALLHEDERRERYDRQRFSVSPFAYLERGCYVEYLDAYRRHFPRHRMHLVVFERLVAGGAELDRVLDFLEVSTSTRPQVPSRPVNASSRQGGDELDDGLRSSLAAGFAAMNRRLAQEYEVDLSCWTSAAGA